MSKSQQMRFGKRKLLVKGRGRPLPRWDARREELRRQARARRVADEMKEIVFRENPNASIHTVYGTVILNGQERKFSIDVLRDPYEVSKQGMYKKLKRFYENLYNGLIPKRNYYAFYLSPDHLLRSKKIPHQGLVRYMGKKIEYKKKRTRFQSWIPGGRKRRIIKREKPRPWRDVQWRILRYKELISEAEQMIVYYRHKIRELGKKLRPYSSGKTVGPESAARIRRAEERFLEEIGWKEEKTYWWKK